MIRLTVEAHGVILALLSARGKLGAYSRWLSTAQFEAVLLSREIRAAVEDYERAWDAVLCLINDADVELLNEVKSIARLDTAFYQPEDQKEEARVRLGYLHPYSLLPNLDLARYLLQNCGDNTSDLGDRLEWAVDHGLTPLARVLHFVGISDDPKDEDLLVLHYKGSRSPFKGATPALVEFGPIGDQSNVEKADRGSGLKEAYEGLKVVHPYVGAGLRILLINAPFGKAVQANLSGILRDLQSLAPDSVLSVEYALVGNKDHELIIDDQSVTGASAGISWKVLGRFSSIEEVLEVAHPAHLSLYFSPTFSGSKVLTVDQVGACEFDVVKAAYGDAYTVKIKHAPHRSALFKGMTRLSGNGAIIAQLDVGDSTETLRGYLSAMKGHSAMKAHSEWVGVASSNVLATPLPRPSVDDGVLGRASIGPYSIHLEYCDGAPLSPILAPITERGPWLLEDSSVLNRLGERLLRVLRTESMTEEIALGVSISLAERALRECGYEEVYEINVDDLSWSRPWLASWEGPDSGTKEERERGRRCDRIFVGLRDLEPEAPTACILFVESKGNYQDVGVSFSPASEPWKKAVTQVEQTYSSLMSLIDERCGVKLNLLDQLRREHFAKHLSSVVIEGHSPPTNDEEKSRYERKYKVLNMLLSGTIPPDSLEVGTLCVLARPKDSTPTGSDQCDVPVSAGAPPLKFVRCERDSLDEDEPLSFVQEVSVGLLAPLIDIDPRCCGGDAEPPPVESVERGGSENVGETPAPASVGAESLGSEGHAGEVVETPRVERGDFVVVIQSDGGVRFTGGGAPEYEVERLERAQVYKTLGGAER